MAAKQVEPDPSALVRACVQQVVLFVTMVEVVSAVAAVAVATAAAAAEAGLTLTETVQEVHGPSNVEAFHTSLHLFLDRGGFRQIVLAVHQT